jgi:serine/threonine protein kinase
MIANKYNLIKKLSQGRFGTIYKGENIRTNDIVAIKFESKNSNSNILKNEAKIYQYLGKENGFPQLKWFGSNDNYNYLVIDFLGISLAEMIQTYKRFCLKTVLILGIQIISRIKILHQKYLLHRDIKPDNFLFGLENQTNKLFLIDFGFAKRYDYNGQHIPEKKINSLIGSPNFVSLNVHNNYEPSRRDDLESCIYVIMNMLYGKLEWFDKNIHEMAILKENITNKINFPNFLKQMLLFVRSIKFDETPNYDYLINLLVDVFNNNNYKLDNHFEWSY